MKAYKTRRFRETIEEIEATRWTDSRVYFMNHNGRETWQNISGQYEAYHKSFADAKAYLIKRLTERLEALHRQKIEAQAALSRVYDLTSPLLNHNP